jgi:cytochrome c biogenesis protein CcmG, thiol:disulfide interchange protein DsbE
MRRFVWPLLGIALVAVLVIGLTQAGGKSDNVAPAPTFDPQAAQRKLAGAPAPLAALYNKPSAILEGGTSAFDKRLATLKGHPAVVNKWASWCRPCRAEFPIFQQVATERGKQIAFLGINGADKLPAAKKFLAQRPLPYLSYEDPHEKIAQHLKVPKFFPMTVFLDKHGKTAFIKSGEYTSRAELEADIDKYLGT